MDPFLFEVQSTTSVHAFLPFIPLPASMKGKKVFIREATPDDEIEPMSEIDQDD